MVKAKSAILEVSITGFALSGASSAELFPPSGRNASAWRHKPATHENHQLQDDSAPQKKRNKCLVTHLSVCVCVCVLPPVLWDQASLPAGVPEHL